jgi:hypothetical protein
MTIEVVGAFWMLLLLEDCNQRNDGRDKGKISHSLANEREPHTGNEL